MEDFFRFFLFFLLFNGMQRIVAFVFSFIAFLSQDVPVNGRNVINVSLASNNKELNEVVVVGYGTQRRGNLTGAISSVAGKDVAETPVTTFEQALQGKTAGVNIQAEGGKLGQGVKISIRGQSSISAGTQPLVVIDGIIVNQSDLSSNGATSNPLADVNFNDIESYEVLKDAASAAIYGVRGANGASTTSSSPYFVGRTCSRPSVGPRNLIM